MSKPNSEGEALLRYSIAYLFEQNTELRRFKESVPWEAISTALIFSTPLYEADRKMLDIVQDWMASNRPEEVEP